MEVSNLGDEFFLEPPDEMEDTEHRIGTVCALLIEDTRGPVEAIQNAVSAMYLFSAVLEDAVLDHDKSPDERCIGSFLFAIEQATMRVRKEHHAGQDLSTFFKDGFEGPTAENELLEYLGDAIEPKTDL